MSVRFNIKEHSVQQKWQFAYIAIAIYIQVIKYSVYVCVIPKQYFYVICSEELCILRLAQCRRIFQFLRILLS